MRELFQVRLNSLFWAFCKFALITSLVFTLTGFLGRISAWLDLTSHFRVQYALVQLVALIWLLKPPKPKRTKPLLFLLVLTALLVNGWQVWRYASPQPYYSPKGSGCRLNLLHANVFVSNKNYQGMQDVIAQAKADVVSLQEVDAVWYQHLRDSDAFKQYPYRLLHLAAGNVLLSRFPLIDSKLVRFPEDAIGQYRNEGGYFITHVRLGQRTVSLINLHPPIPGLPKYAQSYRHYLDLLASENASLTQPVILFGDLNVTPWSYYYREYLRILNLKDAKAHHYMPTWPTYLPCFFLPIDQLLVSPEVQTVQHSVGPFNGSDHLPVRITLWIPDIKKRPAR